MTTESVFTRRETARAVVDKLKLDLLDAQGRQRDALRDIKEAERGTRFGQMLPPGALQKSQTALGRAKDEVLFITRRLTAANVTLRALNIACAESQASGEVAAAGGAKPKKDRGERAMQHERRVLVLLAAARGVAFGSDRATWLDRLHAAVDDLAYCDTKVDGQPVSMPWDDGP